VPAPLLAVDAPSLLYRAFFALPDSIKDAEGRPVNALLGTANLLLQAVEEHRPRAVVLCFGAEAATYRTDAFSGYHADRPPMPGDLRHQWEQARGFFGAFGWSHRDAGDLEADDLLGTLAGLEREAGGAALLFTGDRDMFQCVDAQVAVLLLRDHDDLEALIALAGDPAAVTRKLLRPKVAEALRIQADELRAFQDMARLRTLDTPRPADAPTDFSQAAAAARAKGMNRLGERLEQATGAT